VRRGENGRTSGTIIATITIGQTHTYVQVIAAGSVVTFTSSVRPVSPDPSIIWHPGQRRRSLPAASPPIRPLHPWVLLLLPKYEPLMCIELAAQVIVRVQAVVALLHHGA